MPVQGPQQPGMPVGYAPAAPASNAKLILIVVAVVAVVVVVLLVVLPFLLYLSIAGSGPPPGSQTPTLVLAAGTWNNGNLTISFASVTNAPNLDPADLTYLIQDLTGTTYFTGAAGPGTSVAGTTVTVMYNDNANFLKVSAEDNLRITVSPATSSAIRGGSLKLFFAGDVIGYINQLP